MFEARIINPAINLGAYLEANQDVAAAGVQPLEHLINYGLAEGRPLGNGIFLNDFSNDAVFHDYLVNGNYIKAIERIANVAPFLPEFEFPDNWLPPYNTNIPVDFVPPLNSDLVLIVPPSVAIPEGLILPDHIKAEGSTAPEEQLVTVFIDSENWSPIYNRISFSLEYDSSIKLDAISLVGGGVSKTSISSVGTGETTLASVDMNVYNGQSSGRIQIDLYATEATEIINAVSIKNFTVNQNQYPDVVNYGNVITFSIADLFSNYQIIQESPGNDTSGYETYYSNIEDVFSLPNAKVGLIEPGSPVQAYLHIDPGERFLLDYDTFVLRGGAGDQYRIKITPEDPSLFGSNVIGWLYGVDGQVKSLLMNLIGSNDAVDGSFYSDAFTLDDNLDQYLSVALRWSDIDNPLSFASGPAAYEIELIG